MKKYLTESFTKETQAFSSAFDCGNDNLNFFLKSSLALDLNYGKTYVLLNDARNRIVGYYCLTTGLIEQDGVKIGGSVHIRDFALDKKYQGIVQYELPNGDILKLSDVLLTDCLDRIKEIRNNHIGFSMISLFSTLEGESLYLRNGFDYAEEDMRLPKEENDGKTNPMYRPVDEIEV